MSRLVALDMCPRRTSPVKRARNVAFSRLITTVAAGDGHDGQAIQPVGSTSNCIADGTGGSAGMVCTDFAAAHR